MLIQTANIVSGFVLAAPKLKTFGAKEHVEAAETKLAAFRGTIGIIELGLGAAALLERMGIVYLNIPMLGSSYPQALPAIAIGLILCMNLFEKYPAFHEKIGLLKQHAEWIGIVGILVGLGSILFGCVAPVCYFM